MKRDHMEQVAKAMPWMDGNPNRVYASSYSEVISDEMAGMLLSGDFDGFNEKVEEAHADYIGSGDFWSSWEADLACHHSRT